MYSDKIEPMCNLCVFSSAIKGIIDKVTCEKKGIVKIDYVCKQYRYDVLKRKVFRRKPISSKNFNPEDFSID